ncbi:MAG: CBS domain-containing protein [Zetaproteobacteria bacterium]|nr:MAG: CBS domain-containing protein [Zetaproteobacteria bacterium]
MLTAHEIMNPDPPHCDVDTPVNEVISQLAEADTSGLLVVDEEQRLQGVITESDLVDQQARLHVPTAIAVFDMVIPLGEGRFERELARMQALTAGDLMTSPVQTVAPDTALNDIAAMMNDSDVHCLPVVEGGTIEGVITQHEVIKALAQRQPA